MRPLLVLALLGVVTLTGCAAPVSGDGSEQPPEDANVDACVSLAGGALPDAVDLFIEYSSEPTAVSENDVATVIDRLRTAREATEGELADELDVVIPEFDAMLKRYTGDDPLVPIDYDALSDGLDRAMSVCLDKTV